MCDFWMKSGFLPMYGKRTSTFSIVFMMHAKKQDMTRLKTGHNSLILHQGSKQRLDAPTKKKIARKMHQTRVYKSSTTFRFFIVKREEKISDSRRESSKGTKRKPFSLIQPRRRSSIQVNDLLQLQGIFAIFLRLEILCFLALQSNGIEISQKIKHCTIFANFRRMPCFPDCMQ